MSDSIKAITTLSRRHPLAGPLCWVASVQYFIVQVFVANKWPLAYSWSNNAISDLGNTVCGDYGQRFVCSPSHSLMNASFVVLGLTMILGALLISINLRKSTWSLIGFVGMGLSGLGSILVGLFPENVNAIFHLSGASLAFVIGNMGVVVLGLALNMPKPLRYYTLASGSIGLVASGLFAMNIYLGLGLGGMERLALYLQTIWLVIFGLHVIYFSNQAQTS